MGYKEVPQTHSAFNKTSLFTEFDTVFHAELGLRLGGMTAEDSDFGSQGGNMDNGNLALAPQYRRPGLIIPHRISLNDRQLDEVEILFEGEVACDAVDRIIFEFGKDQIRILDEGNDAVILRIPSRLALQLYHEGILPSDRSRPVDLKVDGKSKGTFRLDWQRQIARRIRQPESVLLRLVRQGETKPLSGEP